MSDIPHIRVASMAVDAGTISVIGATLLAWLPPGAALIAVVWYAIQIIESRTIQKILRDYRLKHLVKLRAKTVALELAIRAQDSDLRPLDDANQIHLATTSAATQVVHKAVAEKKAADEASLKGATGSSISTDKA